MTKKSVRKRIAKRKNVVRKQIVNKLGANIKPVVGLNVQSNMGMSARDVLMRNQMMGGGVIPQNMNMNPQMLAMQNKAESSENRTNDIIKEMNSMKERYNTATNKEIEYKRKVKTLKSELEVAKKDAMDAADRANAIEDLQSGIEENKRLIGEGVSKEELAEKRKEAAEIKRQNIDLAHRLKLADIELDKNKAYEKYMEKKQRNELISMELTEKEKIIQSGQFKDMEAERLLKEEIKQEMINNEKSRVLDELATIERSNRLKQRQIDVMANPSVITKMNISTAAFQRQIAEAQEKEVELDNEIYMNKLIILPLEEQRKELVRLNEELVSKSSESKRLGMLNSNLMKTGMTVGKLQKGALTKLAAKDRLMIERKKKIEDADRILEMARRNAEMGARSLVEDAVNDSSYGVMPTDKNDPDYKRKERIAKKPNPDIMALKELKEDEKGRAYDIVNLEESNRLLEAQEKLRRDKEEQSRKNAELMARINYGKTPEAIGKNKKVIELAERLGVESQVTENYNNMLKAADDITRINTENTIKRHSILTKMRADDQAQIATKALSEKYQFDVQHADAQKNVSSVLESIGEQYPHYWAKFHERYPRYKHDINNVYHFGSVDDLETLRSDLIEFHQWYQNQEWQ